MYVGSRNSTRLIVKLAPVMALIGRLGSSLSPCVYVSARLAADGAHVLHVAFVDTQRAFENVRR